MKTFYDNPLKQVLSLALPLGILLAGCGGPPAAIPLLTQATEQYEQAAGDTMVVRHAPVELKEAQETLQMSRALWTNRGDRSDIEHYAYMAQQRTSIATETARMNAANSELERSLVERQQVLLDVRQSEIARSEARTQAALQQVQRERTLTEQAQQRATDSNTSETDARRESEILAQRVRDLEARPTERGLVLTLGDVLFDTGKSTLRSTNTKSMDELTRFLQEYTDRNILIEGFTDNVGSEALNMELSRNRANAVRNALISRGIDQRRITVAGYGYDFPVASNQTAQGRQQNRRVEIVISDEKGTVAARTR